MTTAQLFKYRAEWSRAWKVLRTAGKPASEKEITRKRWHLYIGAVVLRGPKAGEPKSSTVLTNAEFDRFLKRCASVHTPAGLQEQLDLDEQPLRRLQFATDPLLDLVQMHMDKREAYLAGIYANIQRPRVAAGQRALPIAEMPDADLQLVVIALTHTIEHKLGVAHNHPRTGRGPKSRHDHNVWARKGQNLAGQTTASDRPAYDPDPIYVAPEDDGDPF